MAKKHLSEPKKFSAKAAYSPSNPMNCPGNPLLGYIDPRRWKEFQDHQVIPDDITAPSNCSPRAFQIELKYEDSKDFTLINE